MAPLEFRIILLVLAALILGHILYVSPKNAESESENVNRKYGWLRELSRFQLYAFIMLAITSVAAGVLGLVGMFLLFSWARSVFLGAVLIIEVGGIILFRGGVNSFIEKVLEKSVLVGEVLVIYLVLLGPATQLFE